MSTTVTLSQVLTLASTIEKRAAEFYRGLADAFAGDEAIGGVLRQLAEDETDHHHRFEDLRQLAPDATKTIEDETQVQLLLAMGTAEALSPAAYAPADPKSVKDRDDVLARALEFEKATLAYYQVIRDVMGSDDVIESLVEMEKTHVATLMKVMITEGRMRGLEDPWT